MNFDLVSLVICLSASLFPNLIVFQEIFLFVFDN